MDISNVQHWRVIYKIGNGIPGSTREILVDQGANPAYLRFEVFGNPGFFFARGLLRNLSQPDWPIQEWPDVKQNSHDAINQQRGVTL